MEQQRTDQQVTWRRTIRAASVTLLLGFLVQTGMAQADAWILANNTGTAGRWADLAPANPTVGAAVALPTPGGANGYAGQVPMRSHHVRTNGDGSLIFFAVDGNLYNGDGYLIADARSQTCNACLDPGVMEFISVPVPGSCDLYYLFSGVPSSIPGPIQNNAYVQVAVLDMGLPTDPTASSTDCTQAMGRLLSFDDLFLQQPAFSDWDLSAFYPTGEPPMSNASTSDRVRQLWMPDYPAKGNNIQLRVVDGVNPGDDAFLFFRTAGTLHVFRIAANGVYPVLQGVVTSPAQFQYVVPLFYNYQNLITSDEPYRDSDARRMADGSIVYAATAASVFTPYPQQTPLGNVISMRFNGATGVLVPNSIQVSSAPGALSNCATSPSGTDGGPAGCKLSPDGDRLYLITEGTADCQSWSTQYGYLDLASGQFTDQNAALGIPVQYAHGRMYRGRALTDADEALYLAGSNGQIGLVEECYTTAPTYALATNLAATAPQYNAPNLPTTNVQSHFLAIAVDGDQHLSAASKEQCCTYFETVPGATVEGYTQAAGTTTTWNGTQNTVQPGTSTVVFTCDVVVEPGARLVVNNMNWKFAADARVIVQEGGYLQMNNATLDAIRCPGDRWPGISVLGDPDQSQQGQAPWGVPPQQGMVQLTNCTVSNAYIGILTGSATVGFNGYLYNISNSEGGAVVLANGCTFRNCITAVDMRKYPSVVPQGQPLPLNRSRFNGTTFVVDEPLTDQPFNFKRHVRLDRVSGVIFRKCHFQNLVNDAEYATLGSAALGYGIESYESQFQVLPSCSILLNAGEECPTGNTVPTTFTGLDHGIHAIGGPNALRNFTVDAARFTDNICGVYVNGVIGFVAKRNTFLFGNRNVPLTNSLEANWSQTHRGLYSFKGSRFTVMDNTLSTTGSNPTEGIVIGFSGEEDEIVFRNNASDLLQAYTGEGQCADDVETASQGLWFKCNTNQNNRTNFRSRIVSAAGDIADQTIRTNQGSIFPVVVPADNTFDRTLGLMDFVNDGCDYNAISYWWADPASPFKPEYTLCVSEDNDVGGVPIERSPGNCLTRTRQREFMPTTTEGLLQQAEEEKLEYADQRYLYEQLIDGGNTDEVLLEISSAWPQDAWELRTYLLSKSPFLSVQVLQEAMNKAYFPLAMKAEVCIANPDATKKDGFMKWLQYDALYPMPEHLLASIEASWDQKTFRTSLENALAMHRSELVQSLNQVTEILTGDTVHDPTDSLRAVWQVLRSPGARYAEALLLMQQGQLSEAHAVVSAIPTEHELRPKELDERGRMLQVIALMQAVKASNRSEAELTVAEQNNLAALVEGQLDRPSVWAQNLLCWFYDRCTVPPSGGDDTPKSAKPQRRPLAAANMPMLAAQPNPATTWATFTITLDHEPTDAMVVVRDAQGRIMHQELVNGPEVQLVWDTRQVAQGLYSVELLEDGKRLQTERLIVQP